MRGKRQNTINYKLLDRPKFGMGKIGFKPEWMRSHTKRAREFDEQYTGKEPALDLDGYVKWLHGT